VHETKEKHNIPERDQARACLSKQRVERRSFQIKSPTIIRGFMGLHACITFQSPAKTQKKEQKESEKQVWQSKIKFKTPCANANWFFQCVS
jgi:hypothetical protein